ncbi:eukaryotic rRNA processing protein EBP2-domain-containing protein [Dendryphion nanum]|uniref:Eukaryotic rRNA processing protein EBP2-domain-containing protein n=1 Tax=Dendryphion nanum TaxID=256645 RepID=A0A9P9EJP7_9PLEO|nr:eukaryotic rRNA processing protein EBP2-domain-containing protein [Dendryphion nanum]
MAKTKLRSALDQYRGRNIRLEKQRKKEREARKRKELNGEGDESEIDDGEEGGVVLDAPAETNGKVNGAAKKNKAKKEKKGILKKAVEEPEWETEGSGAEDDDDDMLDGPALDVSMLDDSESDISGDDEEDEEDEDEDEEDQEDIPLSDVESLASEDRGDMIPHQRLTINNTTALTAALNRISLPYSKLAFSEHMVTVSDEPVDIPDAEDDLNRELAFYKQALASAKDARNKLKKEGIPFSRPADYFAEMVKSEEHMGKIKQKLIDAAAGKKASAEARRQRDLKKFGKQVQTAKLQERAKEKRDTLEKITLLKRKRQGADLTSTNEESMFDIALEDAAKTTDRRAPGGQPNHKRQKKDQKYGFGGKKRHAKSNDAKSSADMRDFSTKKMKGKPGAAKQRPGKARRANAR